MRLEGTKRLSAKWSKLYILFDWHYIIVDTKIRNLTA